MSEELEYNVVPPEVVRLSDGKTGPVARKINDPNMLQTLRFNVLGFWPNRKNDNFPAPQPVSLERKYFHKLINYPYLICVKSDGMRFLMMCYNNNTFMVDRAFRFFQVNQCFNDMIYGGNVTPNSNICGALFDGELICNKDGKWTYVIHDCICISGRDISQLDFTQRHEAINTAVSDMWKPNNELGISDFRVETKKFYKFNQTDELKKSLDENRVSHNTDGLIFTPIGLPVGSHTQYTLFKWKPRNLHTFDFKINISDDGKCYNALVNKQTSYTLFGSVNKIEPGGVTFTKLLKERCPTFKSGDIVECDYNLKTECFEPIMIRTDKIHPNSLHTVEKTLCNIQEDITIQELFDLRPN